MMAQKYADVVIYTTIAFEDNGDDDLVDQASEGVVERYGSPFDYEFEIKGPVRNTEYPS